MFSLVAWGVGRQPENREAENKRRAQGAGREKRQGQQVARDRRGACDHRGEGSSTIGTGAWARGRVAWAPGTRKEEERPEGAARSEGRSLADRGMGEGRGRNE